MGEKQGVEGKLGKRYDAGTTKVSVRDGDGEDWRGGVRKGKDGGMGRLEVGEKQGNSGGVALAEKKMATGAKKGI